MARHVLELEFKPSITPKTAGVATGPASHTCGQITITAKEAPGKYISQL